MQVLYIYLAIINAISFILMLVDKYKARKNLWRIPERTFFLIACIGGSLGCILGMYTVRHKTKHPKFTIGMPLIFAGQVMAVILIMG